MRPNNGMWRYLSICVIPDIVAKRWGIDNHDRYWKKHQQSLAKDLVVVLLFVMAGK